MPKTYKNAHILSLTGPPSRLSATNTTSSSCLPKKGYYPSLIFSVSDNPKRLWQTVNNSCPANPPHRYPPLVLALHLQTVLLLFLHAKYPNYECLSPAILLHHLCVYLFSPATPPRFLSFHSCSGLQNLQDPLKLSKQAISFRSHPNLASQRMFVRTRLYSHQYCQPASYFRLVWCHQYLRNRHWIKANSPIMIIIFSATACTQCIYPGTFISLFLTTVIQLLLFAWYWLGE